MIASFDVGIKNLAFCVLKYCPENLDGCRFVINQWEVINILEGENFNNDSGGCQAILTKGARAGQRCALTTKWLAKDGRSYCGHHKPEEATRILRAGSLSMYELACLVTKALDKRDFTMCSKVIIEQQPTKNARMKNLSMLLLNYFAIKYADKINDVQFVHAKRKLTIYNGPYIECKLKTQYARNKFYGIHYCRWLIRNDSQWLPYFESHKKKDDLADAYLQGAWYLTKNCKVSLPDTRIPVTLLTDSDNISANTKVIYEQNKLRYKRLKRRGRKPTKRQLTTGNMTLSNLKYYVNKARGIDQALELYPWIKSSIEFYFGSIDNFKSASD